MHTSLPLLFWCNLKVRRKSGYPLNLPSWLGVAQRANCLQQTAFTYFVMLLWDHGKWQKKLSLSVPSLWKSIKNVCSISMKSIYAFLSVSLANWGAALQQATDVVSAAIHNNNNNRHPIISIYPNVISSPWKLISCEDADVGTKLFYNSRERDFENPLYLA